MVKKKEVREKIHKIAKDMGEDKWAMWYSVEDLFNKNRSLEENLNEMLDKIEDDYDADLSGYKMRVEESKDRVKPDPEPKDVQIVQLKDIIDNHTSEEKKVEGWQELVDPNRRLEENWQEIKKQYGIKETKSEEEASFGDPESHVLRDMVEYIGKSMPMIPMNEIQNISGLPDIEVEEAVKNLYEMGYLRRNDEGRYGLSDKAGRYALEHYSHLLDEETKEAFRQERNTKKSSDSWEEWEKHKEKILSEEHLEDLNPQMREALKLETQAVDKFAKKHDVPPDYLFETYTSGIASSKRGPPTEMKEINRLVEDEAKELKQSIKEMEEPDANLDEEVEKHIMRRRKGLREKYTFEDAKTDIINSPFAEALGWVKNGMITEAGKEVADKAATEGRITKGDIPLISRATEMEDYTFEDAKTDIINSPFAEALGWVEEGELTEAGREAARQSLGKHGVPEANIDIAKANLEEILPGAWEVKIVDKEEGIIRATFSRGRTKQGTMIPSELAQKIGEWQEKWDMALRRQDVEPVRTHVEFLIEFIPSGR